MTYLLVWINGFIFGAFVTALWLWWQLATGRRTVRPIEGADQAQEKP